MQLKVLTDTLFKQSTKQARELSDDEKLLVTAGTEYEVLVHLPAESNHVKATLAENLGPKGFNTWHIFSDHVEIEGNEPDNNPEDMEEPDQPQTDEIRMPGYPSLFYLSDPILQGGKFTWAEATKNGSRIPTNQQVVSRILAIANVMDEVRAVLGDRPITVISWYRDPMTNRRLGGASRSRHIIGDAVDFQVSGISPSEVQQRLDDWWGNRGGLASSSSFTHIDKRGYKARWRYGE